MKLCPARSVHSVTEYELRTFAKQEQGWKWDQREEPTETRTDRGKDRQRDGTIERRRYRDKVQ